ncbi:hypothetical protein [Burkholderia phage FLC9]|nr:hypothetical protein [Burkholderia phage FLC9]
MTTTVRYFAPLVWQGAGSGVVVRQAAPVVWSQQSVNAYLRNLQAIQWFKTPTPVNARKVTALQWAQDQSYVSMRRVAALQWTQDQIVVKVRNLQALTWQKQPTQGVLRQVSAFTLQQSATQGVLRQISAFTLQKTQVQQKAGGLTGLWALIQADAKQTITQAQLTVSAPVADSSKPNTNTYVTVAPAGTLLQQYSGTTKLYYARTSITNAFLNGINQTWLLPAITSATTIRALIPTINTAYGLALDPTDVVDGPVAAGATSVTLVAAPNSYVFLPGTSVYVANQTALGAAITNVNLPGFTSARGNLVDPALSLAIVNTNLPGFDDAAGHGPTTYAKTVLADAPYAYYPLNESAGTTANDLSGNARHGTYAGNMTLGSGMLLSSMGQKVANFPGDQTSWVDVTAAKNFCAGTTWSIEAWVNIASFNQKGGYSGGSGVTFLTDIGDTGSSSPVTGLEFSDPTTGLMYWPKDSLQNGPATAIAPGLNTTCHVVMTYNAGTVSMYVNSQLVATYTGATQATIRNFLRIGGTSWVGGPMNGLMGEVALYTTALTPAQIGTHYAVGSGFPNVVGQQNFMIPGTYSLVVPQDVHLVSGVGIAGGGGGWGHTANNIWGTPGAGAGLGWKNNIPVTPGETLTVVVGAPGANTYNASGVKGTAGGNTGLYRGATLLFGGNGGQPGGNTQSNSATIQGGTFSGDGGGLGGNGTLAYWQGAAGGAGAGGYMGKGGDSGGFTSQGGAGSGGGGGGGSGSAQTGSVQMTGGAGGGTGLYGMGISGGVGAVPNVQQDGFPGSFMPGSGMFGGGASNGWNASAANDPAQGGGLRLIWGAGRSYPSTLTTDQNYDPVLGGPADILAHFEGSTKSGYGFDQCGNSSAGIFNNAILTNTFSAFGTQSVSLAGGVDCIFFNPRGQTDFQVTGDFTFDVFLSKKAGATLSAAQTVMCDRNPGSAPYALPQGVGTNAMASMHFWMDTTGKLLANIFGQTNVDLGYNLWNDIPGSGTFAHVAIQVKGLVLQVYVGGVLKATYTGTTRSGATWTPQINVGNSPSLSQPLLGCYIDEVRFVNGLARYNGNFTVPTQPFHMG